MGHRYEQRFRRTGVPTAAELFSASAAGIAVSGDSGTGKSTFLLLLILTLILQGFGITLIDPHGDLAADIERRCAALPDRLRAKVVVFRFSDTTKLPAINPLAVEGAAGDPLRRLAMTAAKVGHVAKILLNAWGESGFQSRPVLQKWLTRFLSMLARCGLTIPDVRHFFDVTSRVYRALTAAAADFVERLELEQLAELRPRDREEEIASTKNRLLGYLSNPIVEAVLGSPERAFSFAGHVRRGGILICDVSRAGVLRDEDVEIFANLVLHEVLFAAFNAPRSERVPHFVFLDELPVFKSSFELITHALTQVRKFQLRFVCAFQGTQLFPERTEDRLLNALIGQCNAHVVFRHKHPADARFFAEFLGLPSANPWRVKHVLSTPQQYQDGHALVTLVDEAENWSDARQDGGGESNSETATRTESSGRTSGTSSGVTETEREDRLRGAVSRARGESSGESHGRSDARGTTAGTSRNWSSTLTKGGGRTYKQTLVPRILNRRVVSGVQFLRLDEQTAEIAARIARLPVGWALLYLAGRVALVRFPLPFDRLARTPKYAAKKLAELRRLVYARREFESPDARAERRRLFEARLVEHLQAMAGASPQAGTPLPPTAEGRGLSI